ncbi:spondin domain-containing protein [Methylococcus sp. EFPC2]|uniref:spondin domain-containing protein n=1 Tax=Methylococcus sp. EFPC2 TaxID=2812648 RepID=UPI001967A353|nr:spondin domain-containing protein [Methylococcus sp. EFPC2]QSA96536.1 spondin domain-containing protein [Methylococcus sp. EFPC2]
MQFNKHKLTALMTAGMLAASTGADAASVTISITNLSGAGGPAFSPFFVAFHDGSFDPFNPGSSASPAIEALAEFGNGAGLSTEFAAARPDGLSRTVTSTTNGFGPGIFLPGGSGSVTLDLDPVKHRYLSYFAMVVPSNDRFFGNNSPVEIELFNGSGQFTGGVFEDGSDAIWDAGTELDGPTGAAFLVGSNAADSPAQNGVITANGDFSVYAGRATPAGYDFTGIPGSDVPLLRIGAVSAVPVPAAVWLFGSAFSALALFRRKSGPATS